MKPILGFLVGGMGGLLLGVLLGVAFAFGFSYWQTGGVNIPYSMEHTKISKMIKVSDITDGVVLNVKHVMTTQAVYHGYAPLSSFESRETYTHSLWYWTTGDSRDIEVTMTIWGSAEDGTYDIEFGRHAGNSIRIEGFGQTATWPQDGNEGYFSITGVTP